ATCGDGVVDLGEACDEGDANGTDGATCDTLCAVVEMPDMGMPMEMGVDVGPADAGAEAGALMDGAVDASAMGVDSAVSRDGSSGGGGGGGCAASQTSESHPLLVLALAMLLLRRRAFASRR
ncbi:MAG: hypothetical protein AAF938_25605, partial [Myxococcota bacterium]